MSVARVTEIKTSSTKSFDDAVTTGIKRANKTLKNSSQEVSVDDGGITEYRVLMKVTFVLN